MCVLSDRHYTVMPLPDDEPWRRPRLKKGRKKAKAVSEVDRLVSCAPLPVLSNDAVNEGKTGSPFMALIGFAIIALGGVWLADIGLKFGFWIVVSCVFLIVAFLIYTLLKK